MQQRVITIVLLIGLFFAVTMLVSGMSGWRLPDNQQGYAPKQPIAYSHRLHAGELQIECRFCHSASDKSRHAGIPSSDVCMKCHLQVTASFDVINKERQIEDAINKLLDEKTKLLDKKKLLDEVEGEPEADILAETVQALEETTQALNDLKASADALEIPSSQLKTLYAYRGLDENLEPKPDTEPQSIAWVRVHNLPDYVYFNHQAHVTAGVSCQHCHGPVESMERVRQYSTLSMGWCVNCHREATENGIDGKAVHASTDCTVCHH
jgi:hypothetical protein